MDSTINVTFSNRVEALFEGLAPCLYQEKRSPFERILIVVPSRAMKTWILKQCLEDKRLGVAFGFQILPIDEAIDWCLKELGAGIGRTPKIHELALALDGELNGLKEEFPTLNKILEGKGTGRLSWQAEGLRRASISQELAALFLQYGEFCKTELIFWKKEKGWQQALWERVFSEKWQPFYQIVENFSPKGVPFPLQVHLFGISYLSKEKFQFFQKVAGVSDFKIWSLSPCRMYWGDLKSDKESRFYTKFWDQRGISAAQMETLEGLLEDRHEVLANLGKLGREWIKLLEEMSVQAEEDYYISDQFDVDEYLLDGFSTFSGETPTILQALQLEMALMMPKGELKKTNDDSIQIHECSSPYREVEVLYQNLTHLFLTQKDLKPSDVVVLVSNLDKYTPFIQAVFQESQIPVDIDQISMKERNPIIQTFLKILNLVGSSWSVESIFEIFESPYFLKKGEFSIEEMREIKMSLLKEGVYWGMDRQHRESYIGDVSLTEQSERGTLKGGSDLLTLSLVKESQEENWFQAPFDERISKNGLSLLQGEIFGRWYAQLKTLREVLVPFEKNQKEDLAKWATIFNELLEKFLEPTLLDQSSDDKKELIKLFEMLAKEKGSFLPFYAVRAHLISMVSTPSSVTTEKNKESIRFSSLSPMRGVPAKVVCWLGLDDESLPRIEKKNPFKMDTSSIPKKGEVDRYLFLESLLSARSHWILSYAKSPSSLVQMISDYLAVEVKKHPTFGFSKVYFQGQKWINHSLEDFETAKKATESQLLSKKVFFSPPQERETLSLDLLPRHLQLKELKSFAAHPIRYFYQKSLGVYLEEKVLSDPMEEFHGEAFLFHRLLPYAFRYPFKEVLKWAELKGMLPIAPFLDPIKKYLTDKWEETEENLHELGLKKEDVFTIEFSHGCKVADRAHPTVWKVPPVKVQFQGKEVFLTGKIPYATTKGILSLKDTKFEKTATSIPEWLVCQGVDEKIVEKQTLFISRKKTLPIVGNLEAYLEAFLRNMHQPSPLLPPWIEPLMAKDTARFKEAVKLSTQGSFGKEEDPYLEWFFASYDFEETEHDLSEWSQKANELFKSVSEVIQ